MAELAVVGQDRSELGHAVSLREAFWTWLRVAGLSFGGPAGQIAVMHRILVEEKRWISEQRFLHALDYCMLLPGPEAQQLATYGGDEADVALNHWHKLGLVPQADQFTVSLDNAWRFTVWDRTFLT